MEARRDLTPAEHLKWATSISVGPLKYWEMAREFSLTYYRDAIQEIQRVKFEEVLPERVFMEYIWVVHASGFNASVVGKMMPKLMNAYKNYQSLAKEDFEKDVWPRVSPVCGFRRKAAAVYITAKFLAEGIARLGWPAVRTLRFSTPEKLSNLTFIGPVTCMHLARNIGLLDFVKPDLHLLRLAREWNYEQSFEGVTKMCKDIQGHHKDTFGGEIIPLGIIDLCIWYYASTFGTIPEGEQSERTSKRKRMNIEEI